jgi:hypothetical protein
MPDKKMTGEEALAWCKENNPEFVKRLEAAATKIKPLTREEVLAWSKAEEDCVCKHCGRCVLAGPPCCYESVYELYQKAYGEMIWLRKIQGKKDKQILELKKQIEELKLHIALKG